MPHEITMKPDGTAAAIYARRPAWHGLGDVEINEFTAKEALRKTGLDFGVESAPLLASVVGADGVVQGVNIDSHKLTYRLLDGQIVPLGVVGSEYVPINPVELFEFLDSVVGAIDGAHYTAAFGLRNWKQVVCVADTGSLVLDEKGRGDEIKKYIVGRTSHDGSLAFGLKWSNMRVECANMLAMHLREHAVEWKTKHTANVRSRVEQAKIALGLHREYEGEWLAAAQSMIQVDLTPGDFDRWLNGVMVAVQKKNDDDEIDRATAYSIRTLYESSPTNEKIRGTLWGALNAATEFSDWAVDTKGSKTTTGAEAKVLHQIGDTNAKYGQPFKQIAWESSAELVKAIQETEKKRRAKDAGKVKVRVRG